MKHLCERFRTPKLWCCGADRTVFGLSASILADDVPCRGEWVVAVGRGEGGLESSGRERCMQAPQIARTLQRTAHHASREASPSLRPLRHSFAAVDPLSTSCPAVVSERVRRLKCVASARPVLTDLRSLQTAGMSFVKGATNTHAGDDVLAFERLLMRFESIIGDCNKELRNFNESSITLGKDNEGTKQKLAIYQKCQDVSV